MSAKDDKLAEEISEQYDLAKQYLDPVHDRMNDQEELYRCYIDTTYPHNARVFDPRIFRIIETITPRLVSNEPTGSFYPAEKGDVATNEILNSLIKYDWRRAEMFPKLVTFVKSMLLFGTAFGRTYWDFRETNRIRMEPKKLNDKVVWTPKNTEQIKVTEFDGPNFEVLNIYDCFPDPNATDLSNMRWFVYRQFKTLKELKNENDARGSEYWKNLDKLEAAIDAKSKQDNRKKGYVPEDINYREHRRTMLSTQELHGEDKSNPEFVVLVRYTKERWVFMVPEYALIIRDVENPYFHGQLPIVYGVDYPYPGELYGMGEIEPVDRIQRAINAVLNQRLDNVQLTLRSMWKVKKNAGVDLHTLFSAPGNIVTTDDMAAVEALQVPDVTGPTFVQTMNYLTAAMQNGSGITDYTQGIQSDQNVTNNTATGIRLVQQEANSQFKLKIQLFNSMVIERIANQWKDLRIQYTTEKQIIRILGRNEVKFLMQKTDLATTGLDGSEILPGDFETEPKLSIADDLSFAFLNILPEDIQPTIVGNYDYIASPSSEQLVDPIALQQNFFVALDRVKDPNWVAGLAQSGKKLNYPELTEKIFDKLQMGFEMDEVLEDVQPPPPPEALGTEGMTGMEQGGIMEPNGQPTGDVGGAETGLPGNFTAGGGI